MEVHDTIKRIKLQGSMGFRLWVCFGSLGWDQEPNIQTTVSITKILLLF